MITVKDELVDRVARLSLRRFEQRQAERLRVVLDPVEIPGDMAVGGADECPGSVQELPGSWIILVVEADGLGQRGDVLLRPGQEVPAVTGFRLSIGLEVGCLLGLGQGGGLGRIDADHDGLELAAELPVQPLHGVGHAVQHQRAEHGAGEIGQVQDDRLLPLEIVSQMHHAARIVGELQVEGYLRVQMLDDAYAFELLGQGLLAVRGRCRLGRGSLGPGRLGRGWSDDRGGQHRDAQEEAETRDPVTGGRHERDGRSHGFFSLFKVPAAT